MKNKKWKTKNINGLPEDFYIFLTPDDPNENSYIKIIDVDSKFSGVIFVIEYIKIDKNGVLNFHYNIKEDPETGVDFKTEEFQDVVFDIIMDVKEKYL